MHIVIGKCLIGFRTRTPFFCIDHRLKPHIKLNQITRKLNRKDKNQKKVNDKKQVCFIANTVLIYLNDFVAWLFEAYDIMTGNISR